MSNSSFLIKKGVFVMRKHDALQKKKDTADSKKILRTSFQWLYAVIWFLFGFVFLFTVIFKISAFRINKGYETKTACVRRFLSAMIKITLPTALSMKIKAIFPAMNSNRYSKI